MPCSYGFRPNRRAHDAIAEISFRWRSKTYEWVLEGDIKACFDEIDHPALMDRVRARIADKRVLRAGEGVPEGRASSPRSAIARDTDTGTPQGGLCSAEHKPPYEQCWVMRSAGRLALVSGGAGGRALRIIREDSDHAARHGAGPA